MVSACKRDNEYDTVIDWVMTDYYGMFLDFSSHTGKEGLRFLGSKGTKKCSVIKRHCTFSENYEFGPLFRSLVELLCETGLLAICSVLMDNALCRGSVYSALGGGQRLSVCGACGDGGFILLQGRPHGRLDHAVPQVLFPVDLHALDGGFDIRQDFSPPCLKCTFVILTRL